MNEIDEVYLIQRIKAFKFMSIYKLPLEFNIKSNEKYKHYSTIITLARKISTDMQYLHLYTHIILIIDEA